MKPSPLKIEGWFKVIFPTKVIQPPLPKIIFIGENDWDKNYVKWLFSEGCMFQPMQVFTESELEEYVKARMSNES